MRVPGDSSRTRRMQSAKWPAPPSRKSSRSTGGNYNVIQFQCGDGLREVFRFVDIKRVGASVADIAERAAPRALVAHDHEGGGTFAETFTDVRATGFFAYGDQVVGAQDILDLVEAGGRRSRLYADPVRLGYAFGGNDLDRDARGFAGAFLLFAGIVERGDWRSGVGCHVKGGC